MTSTKRPIMTPEESARADSILGFKPAGSLAPLDSTKSDKLAKADGWAHALDAAALSSLRTIEDKIRQTAEEAVVSAVRFKLKLGNLMNNARELFPGDNEFGKWRTEFAKTTPLTGTAPRTLNLMMQMAREFKNSTEFIEAIGWSTAQELIGAPQFVLNRVYDLVESGEPTPTVKETREMVKEAKSSQQAPADKPLEGEFIAGSASAPVPPAPRQRDKPAKVVTEDELAQELREISDPAERFEQWQSLGRTTSFTLAWALLGLLAPNDGESYDDMVLDFATQRVYDTLNEHDRHIFDTHVGPHLEES